MGLFGIEFSDDPLSIFLGRIKSDHKRLDLLVAGYALESHRKLIDSTSKKLFDEDFDITISKSMDAIDMEIKKLDTGVENLDFLNDKLWLAYFNQLSILYTDHKHLVEKDEEICEKITFMISEYGDKKYHKTDIQEYSIDIYISFLWDYITQKDYNEDALHCLGIILGDDVEIFLEKFEESILEKAYSFVEEIKADAIREMEYRLGGGRDPCDGNDITIKEIAIIFAKVKRRLVEKKVLDSYHKEILWLKKLHINKEIIIEIAQYKYFSCSDDKMKILRKEISKVVKLSDDKADLEMTRSSLSDILGFHLEIKTIKEGNLLMEAVIQLFKTVHEQMILHKNENSSQLESQFQNSKIHLEFYFRQSGNFELADAIHKESYIKPDTIKKISLRWKEYWKYKINKLCGADIKRTQETLTKIDKRIKIIIEDEQKNDINSKTKKELKICASKNVPFYAIMEKLQDYEEDV